MIDKLFHEVYYYIQEKEKKYIDFTKRGVHILKCVVTCSLLIGIVANDFYNYKVSNVWILIGLAAGAVFRLFESGIHGILPFLTGVLGTVLILFVFFLLKMFGAGDIKTLAVIGGLYGLSFSITCIVYSIFAGGIIAVLSMIRSKAAYHRFYSLYQYVSCCLYTRKVTSYPVAEAKASGGTIHFTLAILMGFAATAVAGTLF